VILINLLPHREAARKRRKDMFNASMGFALLLGALIGVLVYTWIQAQISAQQDKNLILETEIKRFDAQIKDIVGLEAEIAALRARQKAVEDLQSDRNMPVHLLTELVRQLPDGVYINSMKQDGQRVSLLGVAQSNERVSEFLRNLSSASDWLAKPELVEIVSGNVTMAAKDVRRVSNFNIRVSLVRASDAEKARAAASASSAAASAPRVAPASAVTSSSK